MLYLWSGRWESNKYDRPKQGVTARFSVQLESNGVNFLCAFLKLEKATSWWHNPAVEDSLIHLFENKPIRQREPDHIPKKRKGVTIPLPFSLLFVPLLLIAAAISLPFAYLMRFLQRRSERRFAGAMLASNRAMTWEDFEAANRENRGTAIGEALSRKGPFRLWWTPDDVPAVCPHKPDRPRNFAVWEAEFAPFFRWCRTIYTDPDAGSAKLVIVPDAQRTQVANKLEGVRYVSTCSFKKMVEAVDSN